MITRGFVKNLFSALVLMIWTCMAVAYEPIPSQTIDFTKKNPPNTANLAIENYAPNRYFAGPPQNQRGFYFQSTKYVPRFRLTLKNVQPVKLSLYGYAPGAPPSVELSVSIRGTSLMPTFEQKFNSPSAISSWVLPPSLLRQGQDNVITVNAEKAQLTLQSATIVGLSNGGILNLENPAPPNTFLGEVPRQPAFDIFAWNTFAALNWPAHVPSAPNYQRGFPDLTKTFKAAAYDDLTAWETFKEKREVFNHDGMDPGDWNQKVNYGPPRAAEGKIPPNEHPDADTPEPATVLHQGNKIIYDSFDETVQVASESLEPLYPDGTPNPVYQRPVGPRVWRGLPGDNPTDIPARDYPILYEVKVNYDFYNYVRQNVLYVKNDDPDNPIANLAASGSINLPYRTSSAFGPRQQKTVLTPNYKHQLATGYVSQDVANFYKSVTSATNLNPPLVGAVHLKAAWIDLGTDLKPGDPNYEYFDPKKYHTQNAVYYITDEKTGEPVAYSGTFGLIGLHIIQRIHVGPSIDPQAESTGGTFIFATWEHVFNDKTPFVYSNFYDPKTELTASAVPPQLKYSEPKFYPDVYAGETGYTVKRMFEPISQAAPKPLGTVQVNEMVHKMLPADSIWKNYRLIGTQFIGANVTDQPLDPATPRYPVNENDPSGIGQQVFLANKVIETNVGLQHFKGLPPGVTPIRKYLGVGVDSNPSANYDRDASNVSYGRVPFKMGGCMGCHGVAQQKGFAFSFVLLGGYTGASTDTQSVFDVAGLKEREEANQ